MLTSLLFVLSYFLWIAILFLKKKKKWEIWSLELKSLFLQLYPYTFSIIYRAFKVQNGNS